MRRHAPLAGTTGEKSARFPCVTVAFRFFAATVFALLLLSPAASAQRGTVQIIDTGGSVASVAVDDASGDLYVASGANIKVYDASGAFQFEFGEPASDLAIDQVSHNVYALESGKQRVAKYDAAGNFLFYFGWNVNLTEVGSAPEICPRDGFPGDVCQEGEPRRDPGAIGYPRDPKIGNDFSIAAAGIAVGPGGAVFISEPGAIEIDISENVTRGNNRVQIFSKSGEFSSTFSLPFDPNCDPQVFECIQTSNHEPDQIAVDSQGVIYTTPVSSGETADPRFPGCSLVANFQVCVVKRFTSSGTQLADFAPSRVFPKLFDIAADLSNGDIYVYQASSKEARQYEIAVYSNQGSFLEDVALGLPPDGSGLAVRAGTSRAYTSDGTNRVFVLDTIALLPEATMDSVADITSGGATFHGTANPRTSEIETGYVFEYRPDGEDDWTRVSSSDVPIGTGTDPVPVTQEVSGLAPNTTYHARLTVARELGAGAARSNEISFTTDAEIPTVSRLGASRITDTGALLGARIDPRHAATSYYFQYGTDTSYGRTAPVAGNGDAGAGLGEVAVFERIEGLTADTTYHYCLVAENFVGQAPCEDHTFGTTTTAAQDWSARGLELVNEPDKGNQSALYPAGTFDNQRIISPDGSRVLWGTTSGTPDSTGGNAPSFVSRRTPSGWQTTPFAPTVDQQPDGFAGRLTYRLVAASTELDQFIAVASEGPGSIAESLPNYLARVKSPSEQEELAPVTYGSSFEYSEELVASADLSRAVHSRFLIGFEVGPDITIATPDCGGGTRAGPPMLSAGGAPSPMGSAANPVTHDYAFLYSASDSGCGELPELYATDFATNTPTLISGPALGAQRGASLIGTKPSGEEALFVSRSQLVAEDADSGNDVYLWKASGGPPSCLSCDVAGFNPSENRHIAKASRDFSHVYYLGADGATYVLRTETHELHLVSLGKTLVTDERTRITPDGDVALFRSVDAGTADENPRKRGLLFRYDDRTESLECVSCQEFSHGLGGDSGGGVFEDIVVSDDGDTVAFSTGAALSPRDINQEIDAYEWHNGVVRLVTDGVHEWPHNIYGGTPLVWGISSSGRDLFFSAGGARLTGEEHDYYANVYDARIGGGFSQPAPPAHCAEDACQGPLRPSPALDIQGSSNFHGADTRKAARAHRKKRRHKRRHNHRRAHSKRSEGRRRG